MRIIQATLITVYCSLLLLHPVFAETKEKEQTQLQVPSIPVKEESPLQAASPFWFGSYGRVGISIDELGGQGRGRQITPYAPRLIEDNYLELDLGYHVHRSEYAEVDVITTIAAFDQLFHYSGDATAQLAIRRAYLEVTGLGGSDLWVSLGSRWLRGNDIYLLNFWPLDDLNTVGLTFGDRGARHEAWIHAGVSRLERPSQTQYVDVPAASNFGAERVLVLNRQRLLLAALYERRYALDKDGSRGWKWKLYGEFHRLPEGEKVLEGSFTDREIIRNDAGLIVGLQLGLWGLAHPHNHLNLWARYGRGLAIYDELGEPLSINRDRRSWDAEEYRLALAGNWALSSSGSASVQWGGYLRSYRDADEFTRDYDDRLEGSLAVRPQLNIFRYLTPAVEASVQWSQAQGEHPVDLSTSPATVYQFAVLPAISFGDSIPHAFTRPQFRLIYAMSLLNQAALSRYAPEDPRAKREISHYIGARAEWWFGRGGGY